MRFFSSDSWTCFAFRSRFRMSLWPWMSTISSCNFSSCCCRSSWDCSMSGERMLLITSSSTTDPRPQVMQSRNEMLKISVSRRFSRRAIYVCALLRPVLRRAHVRTAGGARRDPESARRVWIAFHRHQDHVERHIARIFLEGALEQLEAVVAIDGLADQRRARALRRQAVGDHDHVVGPWIERVQRDERVLH